MVPIRAQVADRPDRHAGRQPAATPRLCRRGAREQLAFGDNARGCMTDPARANHDALVSRIAGREP